MHQFAASRVSNGSEADETFDALWEPIIGGGVQWCASEWVHFWDHLSPKLSLSIVRARSRES